MLRRALSREAVLTFSGHVETFAEKVAVEMAAGRVKGLKLAIDGIGYEPRAATSRR